MKVIKGGGKQQQSLEEFETRSYSFRNVTNKKYNQCKSH